MTTYAVSIGQREYRVEIGESHLLVDGEPVVFELMSLNGNGLHLFRRDERSTEMYFKSAEPDSGPAPGMHYEVVVNGCSLLARVDSAQRRARRAQANVDVGDMVAPMPGLIVEVLVEAGQAVQEGDVLLIQESMKMQMQLRAPIDGRVADLRVTPGEHVEKGALLVRVAEEA